MKLWPVIICPVWLAGVAGVAAVSVPALDQREQSFLIHLNASVAEVTPLFGPVREAEWAPGWKPQFIHPPTGAQREGAVFTTDTGHGTKCLWLLTAYQPNDGRVEYVVVVPGYIAKQIGIRVVSDGANRSRATISYRCSALGPKGNQEVAKLGTQWAEHQQTHWQTAVNALLAKKGAR